jgi:hypothetical protein
LGWPQIALRTKEIFGISDGVLGTSTLLVENVLEDESEKYFGWQYTDGKCPEGCERGGEDGWCLPVEGKHARTGKEEL